MKSPRSLLAALGLRYLTGFPIHRGKFFIARTLDRLTRGAPVRSPLGPLVSARLSDTTFWLNLVNYKQFIETTLSGLKEGDVFIDIGANMGMFTLVAARMVGPTGAIFAFEPSMREYSQLERNLYLNGAANVVPFRLALSDTDQFCTLKLAIELESGQNCVAAADAGDGKFESILAMRFDSLSLSNTIRSGQRVFIKIDVEGFEMRVLRGMRDLLSTGAIERIVMEVNEEFLRRAGNSRDEVYAYLEEFGFSGTVVEKTPQYDEVFVRARSVAV